MLDSYRRFFLMPLGYKKEEFANFDTNMIWTLEDLFDTLHAPSKITLVINMDQNGIDPNSNAGYTKIRSSCDTTKY